MTRAGIANHPAQDEDGGPMDAGGATPAAAAMRASLIDEY
jgi:hypothetical protein